MSPKALAKVSPSASSVSVSALESGGVAIS